jgi:hypothetical protein
MEATPGKPEPDAAERGRPTTPARLDNGARLGDAEVNQQRCCLQLLSSASQRK